MIWETVLNWEQMEEGEEEKKLEKTVYHMNVRRE